MAICLIMMTAFALFECWNADTVLAKSTSGSAYATKILGDIATTQAAAAMSSAMKKPKTDDADKKDMPAPSTNAGASAKAGLDGAPVAIVISGNVDFLIQEVL